MQKFLSANFKTRGQELVWVPKPELARTRLHTQKGTQIRVGYAKKNACKDTLKLVAKQPKSKNKLVIMGVSKVGVF